MQAFTKTAADELGLEEDVVKRDLGRVLLACEEHAEAVIAQAAGPEAGRDRRRDDRAGGRRARAAARPGTWWTGSPPISRGSVWWVRRRTVWSATSLRCRRKLDQPLAVIVQSTSAAGKSALMDAVLGFVPAEERVKFSAMTGQSLFYMGEADLAHKVLAIAEEEGARAGRLRVEAAAVRRRLSDRVDGEGQRVGSSCHAHLQRQGPDGDHLDDHGDRRRRGTVEPLPGVDRR